MAKMVNFMLWIFYRNKKILIKNKTALWGSWEILEKEATCSWQGAHGGGLWPSVQRSSLEHCGLGPWHGPAGEAWSHQNSGWAPKGVSSWQGCLIRMLVGWPGKATSSEKKPAVATQTMWHFSIQHPTACLLTNIEKLEKRLFHKSICSNKQ